MRKGKAKVGCGILIVLAGTAALGWFWFQRELSPLPKGKATFVRYRAGAGMVKVLADLQDRKIIRNRHAIRLYGMINKMPDQVKSGTYLVWPGMEPDVLYLALSKPIRQMFRMPETNWARRSANLLEKAEITTAADYMDLWAQPDRFENTRVPVKGKKTLEGFLYPDTYDFPPLLGAEGIVQRQLDNFEKRVMPHIEKTDNLYEILIVASLVELEVAKDSERPIVAGIIYNRLKNGIRLEIDACINYALQEWRPLTYADLKNVKSPFNTYLHTGLPPTPICSPTLKSILAAKTPSKHNFLYYVAMPEKYHLFSETYDEHLRNIAKRKAALKVLNP